MPLCYLSNSLFWPQCQCWPQPPKPHPPNGCCFSPCCSLIVVGMHVNASSPSTNSPSSHLQLRTYAMNATVCAHYPRRCAWVPSFKHRHVLNNARTHKHVFNNARTHKKTRNKCTVVVSVYCLCTLCVCHSRHSL